MYLRKLKAEDAPLMFEWVNDEDIVCGLHTDFSSITLKDCENFIRNSFTSVNKSMAIVSDDHQYMGMVSLKNIDYHRKCAEFIIVVRKSAMGRGYSWFGAEEMMKFAFEQEGLEAIYWCVPRENARAVRFCDKHNFHEVNDIPQDILQRYSDIRNLKWYSVLKGDVIDDREYVAGCKVIRIKTISTIDAGELSFFESESDCPFEIKRVYYISKVPEGVRRGYHAHKTLKQLLYCPYGRIQLILENKFGREEIELSDPSIGVIIDDVVTWREMLWLQKDSVLCVAASEHYDADDYIRDYDEFKKYIS